MKGDYTRFTHDPSKHFTGVLRQQGRLDLDADWNEHVQIVERLERLEAVDVIGKSGRPKRGNGFAVTVGADGDLLLEEGHVYVEGTMAENEPARFPVSFTSDTVVSVPEQAIADGTFRVGQSVWAAAAGVAAAATRIAAIAATSTAGMRTVTLATGLPAILAASSQTLRPRASYRFQPSLPAPAALNPAAGQRDLVYLDVWQRHVTVLEDGSIAEPALRGPDTTTRLQTVWQLRVERVAPTTTCEEARTLLAGRPGRGGGRLTTVAATAPPVDDPCYPAPTSGGGAIDNRLYRVEVHELASTASVPPRPNPTFKWSRDNGSVAYQVAELVAGEPTKVKLERLGRDQVLALAAGDRVEIIGDEDELSGAAGPIAKVAAPPDTARRIITLDRDVSAYGGRRHLKLRRWDRGVATDPLRQADGTLQTLDAGVQVRLGAGNLRVGDWWTFTTRAAGQPPVQRLTDEPPQGVVHAYAPIALVTWAGTTTDWSASGVTPCLPRFPALTEICAEDVCYHDAGCAMGATTVEQALDGICAQRVLRYITGDGQEGQPLTELGALEVGVEDGLGRPKSDVQVRFERTSGTAEIDLGTLPVSWGATTTPTPVNGVASVRVRLGASAGPSEIVASLATPPPQGSALKVRFRVVAETPPTPGGKCTVTLSPGDSIANGIRDVVNRSPEGGELCLRAGVYQLRNTEVVDHITGAIRICGTGPGTVLRAEEEAALRFEYCSHVEIANLRVEGGGPPEAPGGNRINGALTFQACKEVSVTECELLCAEATENARACITVEPFRDDEARLAQFTLSARIENNDLEIGDWQTGVLLTNVREAYVVGNHLRLRRLPPDPQLIAGPRRQLARAIGDILVARIDPDAGDLRVPIDSLGGLHIVRFASDPRILELLLDFGRLAHKQWFEGGDIAALRRYAALLTDGSLIELAGEEARHTLLRLLIELRAVGSGIVIGGSRADSVKVVDNFVTDTVQGIRVATSDVSARGIKRAGDVLIRGNTIRARIPEPYERDRYAVFVGSSDSVLVAETRATIERTARGLVARPTVVEGVRVYGQLGPFASVDRTSLHGFETGVRFEAVAHIPKTRLWSVERTMAVRATRTVRDDHNRLTHTDANVP